MLTKLMHSFKLTHVVFTILPHNIQQAALFHREIASFQNFISLMLSVATMQVFNCGDV